MKFEDNVQLWIDKLRDLMYLDDEPVKSWKLEKGTEVICNLLPIMHCVWRCFERRAKNEIDFLLKSRLIFAS